MKNIEKEVKEIISEKLAVDLKKVIPQASLADDLGADSLDRVELVVTFEDEFDLEIPDEDAKKIKTVKDAVDFIEEKI